jgi:uncharacterized protein (TIGR03118 family)
MHRVPRSRSVLMLAAVGAISAATSFATLPPTEAGMASHNSFHRLNLVADTAGRARITDPNLVNAWGLAFSPTSPLWVSNNGTDTSTLYSGATMPGTPVSQVPLVVSIPGGGAPTGLVYNPTGAFRLSTHGRSGPAAFIFAGEDGDISAWNQTGNVTQADLVAHTRNAVYKGLAMVTMGSRPFLLAANFHRDRVDIFNSRFAHVSRPGAFGSRRVPRGYAPFNVAALGGRVYVSYAKQDADRVDDVAGPGHGFVNVFSSQGRFLHQLVRRGPLDSPWGMAIAPTGFGRFAGKLLVGNFGNGEIHVIGPRTGRVVATLRNRAGMPVVIHGLWGLLPGNGTAGGTSDVWFSAGPGHESHGLLGILRSTQ